MTLLLGILTFILVLVSLFMVLVILAQRAKSDGGVGAALGGGMTEAAFGAESGNVLSKATTWCAVIFFVLSFGLYLGHLHQHRNAGQAGEAGLPVMPELTAPGDTGDVFVPPEVGTDAAAESGLLPSTGPGASPSVGAEATTPAQAPAVQFPSALPSAVEAPASPAPEKTETSP